MAKSLSVVRFFLFTGLLSLLTLFQAGQLETYAQSNSQDLGFSSFSAFPETPTPDSFMTISISIANFGTVQSQGFNVTTILERVGVGTVTLETGQLTNPCATSTFCNIGIPGRQPVVNNSGQQTGLTDPSERQILLSLNTTGFAPGLYRLTLQLDATRLGSGDSTGVFNDPVGDDHVLQIPLPIYSSPEFSPTSLQFFPGSPVPLNSQVTVSSNIINTAQTNIAGTANVQFFYCQQSLAEAACQPDNNTAFGVTAGRALSLVLDETPDNNNDGSDDNFRKASTAEFQSGVTASATVTAILDTSQLSPGLYRIGVRVTFLSTDASLTEADTNNNEITALLTIGGSVGGGSTEVRKLLVLQNQIEGQDEIKPLFISPQQNRLTIFDRTPLEELGRCSSLLFGKPETEACDVELQTTGAAFISGFEGADDVEGTLRLDILGSAFAAFDQGFTGERFIINDWQFDADINVIAENPNQPIVYIGLSDGVLIRLNIQDTITNLGNLTTEDLVSNFGFSVRANSEITALLPLSNGVVIGVTEKDTGAGRVYFIQDDQAPPARLSSTATNMGRVHKFEATPGFLFTVTDSLSSSAPLLWITRIRSTIIDTISRTTTLQGLSGEYSDFVVNRSSRMFIATNNGDVGTVFSYRLSPTQNTSTPLFEPWSSFINPADNETALNLTNVQTLALGDVTPNTNGDETLYIGTSDRLYTVETQRQFSSSGDLLWTINVGGSVSSFEVNTFGSEITGFSLLATSDNKFNFVDGRNRSEADQDTNLTVSPIPTVITNIFSEDRKFGVFIETPRILAIYGSDALYFTAIITQ